jgi:hypothetical protein
MIAVRNTGVVEVLEYPLPGTTASRASGMAVTVKGVLSSKPPSA